jgi:hypothetical protein
MATGELALTDKDIGFAQLRLRIAILSVIKTNTLADVITVQFILATSILMAKNDKKP